MATKSSLLSFLLLYATIPLALSLSTPCGKVTILCQDTNDPACCVGECCPYLDIYKDAAALYAAPPIAVLPQTPPKVLCAQGVYVNCLVAPCLRSSCPAYPDATCTNDQCGGCNARWSLSGIQLTREECFASVAPPTPKPTASTTTAELTSKLIYPTYSSAAILPAILPCMVGYHACAYIPCSMHSCDAYPAATCANDFCGGCNAVFRKQNGDILTETECKGVAPPELIQPDVIRSQLPPVLPQATQSGANTGCAAGFVNCLVRPCSVNSCPEHPTAICTDNNCGGCNAVFTDHNGNELTGRDCGWTSTPTPPPPTSTTTTTPPPTTTTALPVPPSTSTTEIPQRPPCIVGFATCDPVPCLRSQCRAHPTATCTNDFCGGCHALWTDTNGNVLTTQECAVPQIVETTTTTTTSTLPPPQVPPVNPEPGVSFPPIDIQTTTTTTTRLPQPEVAGCTLGYMFCNPKPCAIERCEGYPNPTCTNNFCGGCYAIFKDENGLELTTEQCAKVVPEPSLPTTTSTTTTASTTRVVPSTTTTTIRVVPSTTATTTTTTRVVPSEPLPSVVSNKDTTSTTTTTTTTTSLPPLVQPEIIADPIEIPAVITPDAPPLEVQVDLPPKAQPEVVIPEVVQPEVIPPVSTPKAQSTTLSTDAPICSLIGQHCSAAVPETDRCCLHSGVAECLFDIGLFDGANEIGRCCIKHRKKGCTVDSDCCRVDGICNSNGKCKRDRSILVAAAVRDVDNKFDNFEMVNDKEGTNYMTISISTVTLIFVVVLLVIPMGYYWYYKKCILKKLKQEVRREVFHGLEVSAHSDNEFEDSSNDEYID